MIRKGNDKYKVTINIKIKENRRRKLVMPILYSMERPSLLSNTTIFVLNTTAIVLTAMIALVFKAYSQQRKFIEK